VGVPQEPIERQRIDTWLWVARFVKTRALAVDAVKGGRVHVNGGRVKPSKEVRPGDRVEVLVGEDRHRVDVVGFMRRRGPATEAQELYLEHEEDRREREARAEQRRRSGPVGLPSTQQRGRPTKRDRRRYESGPGARGRQRG
jgi:ribosome-associated heat shock protein Hsp15